MMPGSRANSGVMGYGIITHRKDVEDEKQEKVEKVSNDFSVCITFWQCQWYDKGNEC